MITESPTRRAEDVRRLAERLSALPQVNRYSDNEHDEAWTLAHAVEDLEESFHMLMAEKFPRLTQDDLSDDELYDLLLEVGEEFRHIRYHLRDPRFFRYLTEPEEAR